MAKFYREDTSHITVTVDGVVNGLQCASHDGGHAQAATSHVFPGNEESALAIGGLVTPSDVTLEIHYTDSTAPLVGALYAACGKARVTSTVTPKDGDGNVVAGTITWTGVLKDVVPPKRDSATSGKAMLGLVYTPDAPVSTS